ncbi:hypothetical protein EV656_105177 [Rhodovulum adriaticum]|uniref:Transposase n=1 Tax=Rhodovulum adriaticum TaxID=35804 RepID=A0A4R2NNL4_RHOAD|nr:hypothetical protein EV656_105177 [Rhodovulum adriaticum]
MKRSRFTEEQIIAILKQQESGVTTADVCPGIRITHDREGKDRRRVIIMDQA